jgi:hypothetical protein
MLVLKAWMLPLLALALTVPIVAAFVLGGPAAGMAAGALMVAAIVIVAARLRPDEPIEVATRADDRYRVLVIAVEAIDSPAAVEAIVESLESATARWETTDEATEVLVVAPAFNRRLAHWLSDVGEARLGAQRRLAISLAGLAAANVDARGRVGDSDALQALEDALRGFPADEVFIVTGPRRADRDGDLLVSDTRRRLDLPLRRLVGTERVVARDRVR